MDKLTLDVEPFDIRDYITNYHGEGPVYADKAKAIHAIIRALETVENLDLKSERFHFGLRWSLHRGDRRTW